MPALGVLSAILVSVVFSAPVICMVVVRVVRERLWPAQRPRPARDGMNILIWFVWIVGEVLLAPFPGGLATLAVNAVGGGLIPLPSHGIGLAFGAAVYLVAMDFGEWAFHRAQHKIPALWALHSLHHSDEHFDSTTTTRHFWGDPLLKSLTIWLAVGLIFKTSPAIVLIYTIASYYNYVTHSNTRLDFGRWSWVWNSPGYHRLHHSASPEHYDRNFAGLLPIFDVLAGTYQPARPGERPATGLGGDTARSVLDVVLWPMRKRVRRFCRTKRSIPAVRPASA